ncbi:MAG: transcriptional repressor, partial [Candidatus Cloacimonetes bacterium]|nr:transcriptional repressor [Candidatus Cloacimonadota bacterium]
PSYQRIKILLFIYNKGNHPTIEDIYSTLHPEIPTLSKTTVYNTVRVFMDAGIIKSLQGSCGEIRYDNTAVPHAHLICKRCGKIYDLKKHFESFRETKIEGHLVLEQNICLCGVCKSCLEKGKDAGTS